MSNHRTVEALTSAASRSFGGIVNIFKKMGDMGYETYRTLYNSYVLPVANYAAGVWGLKNYPAPEVLQNQIEQFYLGVHKIAPLAAIWIEKVLLNIGKTRRLEMIRLMNRITGMSEDCLPRIILGWEIIHGCTAWLGEVLQICKEKDLPSPIGPFMSMYIF